MSAPVHPAITAYLEHLRSAGKGRTATGYAGYLRLFTGWLDPQGIDLLHVTTEALIRYQVWIQGGHRTARGQPLAKTSQATAIIVVKGLYRWMAAQGVICIDPAAGLTLPRPARRLIVRKDHLTLQEATALVQTLDAISTQDDDGPHAQALAVRNLALIALAFATGRRCRGLLHLRLEDLDQERNELRVAIEKGRTGRVLPVAPWAMAVVKRYLTKARPILARGRPSPWMFVSLHSERLSARGYVEVLSQAVAATIRQNPDLTDLPHKRISTHSLRVTFATIMFQNGCGIRSLNELMLHECLSTTAQYTPIPLEDLRRVLLATHPRA